MALETGSAQTEGACAHPAGRVYAWVVRDEYGRPTLCAGCSACGTVLAGEAEPIEEASGKDAG